MNNIFVRVLVFMFATFGMYKMFPQISKPVDYYIKNPSFQSGVVSPAVNNVNKLLPEKIQIPTPTVLGAVSSEYTEPPLKTLTDEISKQVASAAAEQVVNIKKTASDQFCQALLEKIKSECGY